MAVLKGVGRPLAVAVDARVLGQRGIGRYLANLLRAVAASREDVRLRLYLGRASVRDLVPRDPRFDTEDLSRLHPVLAEQCVIPWRARSWGADVLHFPDNTGPLGPGLPLALTLHDTLWLRPLREAIARPTARQRLQDPYRKFVCPRAAHAAALVLTVSRHSAAAVAALGVDPARVRVLPSAADPAFREPLPAAQAAELRRGLGVEGSYVLASGASDRRKNIDRLILAFARARAGRGGLSRAELVVTSLRPGEAATTTYARTAASAGVAGAVRFLPYVDDPALKALYQGALCYAFPSLEEGFGLPVLEAFGLGCPVLAARAGALPEVAGPAAVYADPLDVPDLARGLARACAPGARFRLARAGRARAVRFSWDRSARGHLAAFAEAAGRPAREAPRLP